MIHVGDGKRNEWEFEYTAIDLARGAIEQKKFRLSRAEKWSEVKAEVMKEVKESGIEVSESAMAGFDKQYSNTTSMQPTVMVRADLQLKLREAHTKIETHTQAAHEYEGWIQLLNANPQARLKLTQADWLYFFGKV